MIIILGWRHLIGSYEGRLENTCMSLCFDFDDFRFARSADFELSHSVTDFTTGGFKWINSVFRDLDDAQGDCLHFDQDHSFIIGKDVEKDVAKDIIHTCQAHKSASLFLKDFENDHHFVI